MEPVHDETKQGTAAACGIALILLAAVFWMSPSAGMLFGIALLVVLALGGVVLALACGIGMCEAAAHRIWRRSPEKGRVQTVATSRERSPYGSGALNV